MNEELLTVQRDIDGIPGGWRYTVPETGVTLTAGFFHLLLDKVVKHLKANGHAVSDERLLLIEDGACKETKPPGSRCAKRKPKPIEGGLLPLLMYTERFIRCVWQAFKDRKFVPREEAERRLSICLKCPMRSTTPGGCVGCYTLLKKANTLLESHGALKIEADEDGFVRDACSACWCLIPLKSWMENATLDKCESDKRPNYDPGCWRLEK